MQVKYWMEYEGLAKVLGEEGARNFAYWYCEHNPTPAETLRRARQYLTSDSNHEPHMASSEEVRKKRKRKREMIAAQMGSTE